MTEVVTLGTDRLTLRPWRDADLGPFADLNANPDVMEHFPARMTSEASDELAGRIRTFMDEHGWGLWAVEAPDLGFVGFTGLSIPRFEAPFAPCVEIAWRLAPAAWGRGYATEAARAALGFGFDDLHLDEIVSFTTARNERSRRVMHRLGMTRDAAGDFSHPTLPPEHPISPHVLYRLSRDAWGATPVE